ncbi:MAG: NAD-dependent epimerase [Pseudomonadota bacterium]
MSRNILLTGAAGFIGMHLAERLLQAGDRVLGFDSLNDYYDPALKKARLAQLKPHANFRFIHGDLADRAAVEALFAAEKFDVVVHLAAQAGVRYSLSNPHAYIDSNLVGFNHILEGCRHAHSPHLVFASSSSVYGANGKQPFSERDNVDHPLSLYAASKKANELMAHTYASLYGLPVTGLRFFTVYGPWYRPDMALFQFTRDILAGKPIQVFNHGNHRRDFTYIDDIVEGIVRVMALPPKGNAAWDEMHPDPSTSRAPYAIYNIGHGKPEQLMDYIAALETALGKKAVTNMLPKQPGDVAETFADVSRLTAATGFTPSTPISVGVPRFVNWYRSYYDI